MSEDPPRTLRNARSGAEADHHGNNADGNRSGEHSTLLREGDTPGTSQEFLTLGSDSRLRILQELIQADSSIAELAEATKLHPVTVRYHVNILLRDGLVKKVTRSRGSETGRPPVLYGVRQNRLIGGFPPRQYEILSELLFGIVVQSLGHEGARRRLYEAGRRVGEQLVETLERDSGMRVSDPESFVRLYLEGALAELGIRTVIVRRSEDLVQYRVFACPFQELALKYPDEICGYLDVGFHEGLTGKMGTNAGLERLACMGHGAPHCEYSVRWTQVPEEGVK